VNAAFALRSSVPGDNSPQRLPDGLLVWSQPSGGLSGNLAIAVPARPHPMRRFATRT